MAGYGNLFETDTESLLNEMNSLEQKQVVYTNSTTANTTPLNNSLQMNNAVYTTHPHQQMQQQQQGMTIVFKLFLALTK